MNWKCTLWLFLVLTLVRPLSGQSEFYIKGNAKVRVDGVTPVLDPVLYVNGSLTNDEGSLRNNSAIIELTRDWTNLTTSTGVYTSTGTERFSGTDNSIVYGTMNGATTNAFNDLKIDKADAGDYVSLTGITHVKNTVEFETNGIVRTDVSSHGDDGDLYAWELYILNNATGAIIGAATAANEGTKYIEGRLRRQVAVGTYFYPIGLEPGILDAGTQPIEFTFTAAENAGVVAYMQDGTLGLNDTDVFSDIGTDPIATQTNDFSICASGTDGILDHLSMDVAQPHEWVVLKNVAGNNFSYSVTVFPSTSADVNAYAPQGPCITTPLRYLAKDQNIAGIAAVTPPSPWGSLTGYVTSPTGYTLLNQSGFSIFRLYSISGAGQGTLGESILNIAGNVLLQGAYNLTSHAMDVGLNPDGSSGSLPLTDPYGLGITAIVNPNTIDGIVDWVKIELREAATPANVLKSVPALVKSDGTLVGLDGTATSIGLGTLAAGNYHIAIRHRNHLGVRTASPQTFLANTTTTYNFTTAQSQAYQNGSITTNPAMKDFGDGKFGLWGGNANGNTVVNYGAVGSDRISILTSANTPGSITQGLGNVQTATVTGAYSNNDVNMNGIINYGTFNTDRLFILSNVLNNDQTVSITEH